MMRTRDVNRWHHSIGDAVEFFKLSGAFLVLRVLDEACIMLERWIDAR